MFTGSAVASALVAKDAERGVEELKVARDLAVSCVEGVMSSDLAAEVLIERDGCVEMSCRRALAWKRVDESIVRLVKLKLGWMYRV